MKKISTIQLVNIIVTIAVIVFNGLANALPLNGLSTGDISDRFDVLFVPAGYVFSIWGLIYLGLIIFAIFQALPAQKESEVIRRISPAYWLASLANITWLFLWHYEVFLLTPLAMLVILGSLIAIYLRMRRAIQAENNPGKYTWTVKAPFSLYLGWISVATIANLAQFLYFTGWSGWSISATTWTVLMLIIATILGFLMLIRERDWIFAMVLIWAFAGIANKQIESPSITTTVYLTIAILFLTMSYLGIRKLTERKNA